MPLRAFNREQAWLMPPSLEDLLPQDHQARFVDALLDGLSDEEWEGLEIDQKGNALGAPAYHPRALLGVWVYGFMSGVRTTRKLEQACRDQIPFCWLACMQRPDHNTLWRFWKQNRERMRGLLRLSVQAAVKMGLVDLAFQAVDGTKVPASASREKMLDEKGLERLLEQVEAELDELEAQNGSENGPGPSSLPLQLQKKEDLRRRALDALEQVRAEDGPKRASPADPDVRLMKSRGGYIAGYNAQAAVSPVKRDDEDSGGGGLLITAADVAADQDDHPELLNMTRQAEANAGRADATLADAGYHSGPNAAWCAQEGMRALMPGTQDARRQKPYHKEQFVYSEGEDVYVCPEGEMLTFRGMQKRVRGGHEYLSRVYRIRGGVCRACPAFGECTTSRKGRIIYRTPFEEVLRRMREDMASDAGKALYAKRKHTVEPVFGVVKEQMGLRRFWLRGMENVKSEWLLLAAAFNLRTLWRVWKERISAPPAAPAAGAPDCFMPLPAAARGGPSSALAAAA